MIMIDVNYLKPGPQVLRMVIGKGSVSNQIMLEANSMNILINTFDLDVNVSNWMWSDNFNDRLNTSYKKISNNHIFDEWRITQDDHDEFDRFMDERRKAKADGRS